VPMENIRALTADANSVIFLRRKATAVI